MTGASVKITSTETGESRIYLDEYFDGETGVWAYEDGNQSCDCNRSLYFEYAHGISPQDADMAECSTVGNVYRIDSIFWDGRFWMSELKPNITLDTPATAI